VATDFGLREKTSFRTPVAEATWTGGEWVLRTKDGEEDRFDFIVTAAGGLVRTRKPALPGLESFAGAVFHSAEWDHDVPLDGRRVGVVGTGSTGMQITRALAPRASHFTLFQRTPQWIFPLAVRLREDLRRRHGAARVLADRHPGGLPAARSPRP
jgi:cation diffusion facilitator CzcD-associated flavoprotein CzcO